MFGIALRLHAVGILLSIVIACNAQHQPSFIPTSECSTAFILISFQFLP